MIFQVYIPLTDADEPYARVLPNTYVARKWTIVTFYLQISQENESCCIIRRY